MIKRCYGMSSANPSSTGVPATMDMTATSLNRRGAADDRVPLRVADKTNKITEVKNVI
jgi:hypothetical protein